MNDINVHSKIVDDQLRLLHITRNKKINEEN